jgi:hypothetical protein
LKTIVGSQSSKVNVKDVEKQKQNLIDRKVEKEYLNGNIRMKGTYLTMLAVGLKVETNIIDLIYKKGTRTTYNTFGLHNLVYHEILKLKGM